MPGEPKPQFIHRLFERMAHRYDRFNRLASFGLDQGWRRIAVARVEVAPGMRVLDLCTGTGDLALRCAQHLMDGRVVGVDFSQQMLALARRKTPAFQQARVTWLLADGEQLPFPPGSFDRALIGFSTRNFGSLERAAREVCRVLRPGGRWVILEAGKPQHPLWRMGYHLYLAVGMPVIGFVVLGTCWPFQYLRRSIRAFYEPPQFMARLQAWGFARVRHEPLNGGIADLFIAEKT